MNEKIVWTGRLWNNAKITMGKNWKTSQKYFVLRTVRGWRLGVSVHFTGWIGVGAIYTLINISVNSHGGVLKIKRNRVFKINIEPQFMSWNFTENNNKKWRG